MDTSTGAWRRWIWIFVAVQLVGLHLTLRPNPFPELAGFLGLVAVIGATIVAIRRPGVASRPAGDRGSTVESGVRYGSPGREARARERTTR